MTNLSRNCFLVEKAIFLYILEKNCVLTNLLRIARAFFHSFTYNGQMSNLVPFDNSTTTASLVWLVAEVTVTEPFPL
jgi:hypothetical protein